MLARDRRGSNEINRRRVASPRAVRAAAPVHAPVAAAGWRTSADAVEPLDVVNGNEQARPGRKLNAIEQRPRRPPAPEPTTGSARSSATWCAPLRRRQSSATSSNATSEIAQRGEGQLRLRDGRRAREDAEARCSASSSPRRQRVVFPIPGGPPAEALLPHLGPAGKVPTASSSSSRPMTQARSSLPGASISRAAFPHGGFRGRSRRAYGIAAASETALWSYFRPALRAQGHLGQQTGSKRFESPPSTMRSRIARSPARMNRAIARQSSSSVVPLKRLSRRRSRVRNPVLHTRQPLAVWCGAGSLSDVARRSRSWRLRSRASRSCRSAISTASRIAFTAQQRCS